MKPQTTNKKCLTDIIYQYKDSEFSWEDFDCCTFTALVIEEYTGKKLPLWREKIKDIHNWDSALKILKDLGGETMEDVPSIFLGTKKKSISEVKLGEPVYYINEAGVGILGICNGQRAYFLQRGGGLTARNIEDCKYCWSIN
jgi:hypothetical protein